MDFYITDHLKWWAENYVDPESGKPDPIPGKELYENVLRARAKILAAPRELKLQTAHKYMDVENEASGVPQKSSCKAGCSFCCHQRIMVIEEEIDLILSEIKKRNMKLDMDRLKKQSKLNKNEYFAAKNKDTKCVFLQENGQCGIYEVRPSSCRNYFVQSDPKYCNSETRQSWPEGKKYPFSSGVAQNAHYYSSALMNMSRGKTGSLAGRLYERLK